MTSRIVPSLGPAVPSSSFLRNREFRRRSGGLKALTFVGLLCVLTLSATPAFAQSALTQVTDVSMTTSTPGTASIKVKTSQKPSFTVRVGGEGQRLIVDLAKTKLGGAPPALVDGNDVVSGVMTQTFADPPMTRVLISLKHQAGYRVRATDDGITIELEKAEKTTALSERVDTTPRQAEAKAISAELSLSDVRFAHQADRDQVIIELSGEAKFKESNQKGVSRIEIQGARLPSALERTLDVGAFRGVIRRVSTYRKPGSQTVIVDIERDEQAKGVLSREGNTLVYTASMSSLHSMDTGIASDGGAARKSRTIMREEAIDLPEVETKFTRERATESDQADAFLPSMAAQAQNDTRRQAATGGGRIEIDLKDADVHDVLRLIADVGRVNIVTADNVTGSVTIRMRNVPWEQALETVLQAKGFGMVRKGNMIRVAPIADLNKERELAIARRKSEFELASLETRLIPVSYAAASEMQARGKDLLSPRGSIAVDERTNVLIVRDITGNLNQIEELVRALDTQTPQVLIEARIVEAGNRFLREVGIQWGGDALFSQATGNDTGIAFPNSIGLAGGATDAQAPTAGLSPIAASVANPNYAVNLPATVGTGSGGAIGLAFGSVDGNFNLNVRLSAAESSGIVRIISSPRILTLDNRQARISSGTLIPFSQVGAQGVQTVFQEAKLQLLVTPHVTNDSSVLLKVKINRDEPDFNRTSARGDPTILKREAQTELLVQDGHTAVIGGIYTRNTGRELKQVPLLGDIPILGVLFQSRRSTDERSELVIFITPRIVNRAEALGR